MTTSSVDSAGVITRPPLLYLAALLMALALHWFWPMPILNDRIVIWVGSALAAFGIAIAVWGRRAMLAAGTNVDPTLPSTVIVTSGPFRITRNPLHLALTLLYVGLTLAIDTWWGFVGLVPLLVTMHVGVVLREERYLEQKFGDEYRRYKVAVARYLPLTGSP